MPNRPRRRRGLWWRARWGWPTGTRWLRRSRRAVRRCANAGPQSAAREAMMAVEEGDPIPAVEVQTPSGGTVSLASYAGRPFVLYFYPRDDTSGCTREA